MRGYDECFNCGVPLESLSDTLCPSCMEEDEQKRKEEFKYCISCGAYIGDDVFLEYDSEKCASCKHNDYLDEFF